MADISSSNSRIAKNTLFLYIRMGIVLIVSLYTSRVVLRTLGATDFGVFNVIGGFVSMFAFLNSAMSSSVQRFFNFELGKNGGEGLNKVFTTAIINQLILLVVITLLCEGIGIWYLENKMVIPPDRMNVARILLQLSILSMAFVIMGVPFSGLILAYERMDFYAIVSVVEVMIRLGLIIVLPHVPYDKLLGYALICLFNTVLSFVLYVGYAKLKLKHIHLIRFFDRKLTGSMLSFSGFHAYGSFCTMLSNQGVNMVLNLFFGPIVNAATGISYQVNSAVMGFVGNITMAARPQMIQSYSAGDRTRAINLMYTISKICYLACFVFVLPLCLEMDYVLSIWLGSDAVPENTASFTIVVLLSSLVSLLNGPVTTIVHATGTIKNYHLITATFGLLLLPTGYIVLKLGALAISVFYVTFVFYALGQLISIFILRKLVSEFSIRKYARRVLLPLLCCSILSAFIPIFIKEVLSEGFLSFCLIVVLSILSSVGFFYLICFDSVEKKYVNRYFYSFIPLVSGKKS